MEGWLPFCFFFVKGSELWKLDYDDGYVPSVSLKGLFYFDWVIVNHFFTAYGE